MLEYLITHIGHKGGGLRVALQTMARPLGLPAVVVSADEVGVVIKDDNGGVECLPWAQVKSISF